MEIIKPFISLILIPVFKYMVRICQDTISSPFRSFSGLPHEEMSRFLEYIGSEQDAIHFSDILIVKNKLNFWRVKYSLSFTRHLFYYVSIKNIYLNDSGLSAFLNISGAFICGDDGTVEIKENAKWMRWISIIASFILIFISVIMFLCIKKIAFFMSENNYILGVIWSIPTFVATGWLVMACYFLFMIGPRFNEAMRFARKYQKYLENETVLDIEERNLRIIPKKHELKC